MTNPIDPLDVLDRDRIETLSLEVTPQVTAKALASSPDERLPEMFATPFMIAAMERACANLLSPLMHEGDLSVGAKIEVGHFSPTAVGATVRASAKFAEYAAPLFWFEVWAEDDKGKIGKGRIARAIVKEADLIDRARG